MKIFDIIEYQGDNKTLVYKHEATDFNTHSTLIVHESQRAILFRDGQALDMFPPGRHVLNSDNIPLLRRLINIPTDGKTPFKCEVYFINKTEQMSIKWGVGDVDFRDPFFNNYKFTIGANGELSIRVVDERRLLVKLVGTETEFTQDHFIQYFKSELMMHVKSDLPKLLSDLKVSVYSLENDLPGLSKALQSALSIAMLDYGISIEKLWINTIQKPVNDSNYHQLNELYAQNTLQAVQAKNDYDKLLREKTIELEKVRKDKEIRLIEKQTEYETGKMDVDLDVYRLRRIGITRQQELGFEVMNNMAKNEGAGSDLRNMGMGLGVGFGFGGTFGEAASEIAKGTFGGLMSSTSQENNNIDTVYGNINSTMFFGDVPHEVDLSGITGGEAGQQMGMNYDAPSSVNIVNEEKHVHDIAWFKNEVEKLSIMKDIMTPEEYEAKRQELIGMIGKG